MNERIRELAVQVGLLMKINEGEVRGGTMAPKLDEFAELIVKECILQCEKRDPRPDKYSDMEEFAESRKVRECISSIKEQFGVE